MSANEIRQQLIINYFVFIPVPKRTVCTIYQLTINKYSLKSR